MRIDPLSDRGREIHQAASQVAARAADHALILRFLNHEHKKSAENST